MAELRPPDIVVCPDRASLASAAAARVAELLAAAIRERGLATVALAGGSTPRALHGALVAGHRESLDWSRVTFAFGDERLVQQRDRHCNAEMARRTLLRPLGVAWDAVLPVPTGVGEASYAAFRYEETLRLRFAEAVAGGEPTFDLVLLGMGGDGHTASLFPDDAAGIAETRRWVRPAVAPEGAPARERVTLTLPAITAARRALFLVAGEGKREAVRAVLGGGGEGARGVEALPAARVRAKMGVEWWLDAVAWGGGDALPATQSSS